ncbi:hypothetical protein [Hymenobacter sp. YC55]|uniref:hypothetical protein n=1 Tax=Hymenobacter sp. YC55 TaxID=3034019 RepID=UPI0023F862C2|nr:hypothetical protein [Hymenobacter sp. YC55]MDF7812978.1 hypothetical protein [Hymenobacter sp. YC55]
MNEGAFWGSTPGISSFTGLVELDEVDDSVVAGDGVAGCVAGFEAGRAVVELVRVVGLAVLDVVVAGLVAVAFDEVVVDLVVVLVGVLL